MRTNNGKTASSISSKILLIFILLILIPGQLPHSAEAQSKKAILCVKRGSQGSSTVYYRSSTRCPRGETQINSLLKGDKGEAGEQGPVGAVGATGLQGATGATGAVGGTGPQGATGATGAVGPQGSTGATGPQGAAGILSVDPVHGSLQSVSSGANVVFDTVVYSSGNISYNSVTGVITFQEAGQYNIAWQVSVDGLASLPLNYDPQVTPPFVSFALSSSQGDLFTAALPTHIGSISSTAIIEVVVAPVTLSLLHTSQDWAAVLSSAASPKATLHVTKINSESSPANLFVSLQ